MITKSMLYWIAENRISKEFPDVNLALAEPDGLLAIGGDLNPNRLLEAYRKGIFPWYSETQPIMWWSPDPRCVLLSMCRNYPVGARRKILPLRGIFG